MRKFRLLLTFLLTFTLASSAFAQGKYGKDSAECVKYLSFYKDYFKQNNMEEASPLWREAFRLCPPQASQNMIIDGQKIMKYWIDRESDANVKKSMIDTLMNLHDLRTQYYPSYKHYSLANKALDLYKYSSDDKMTFDVIMEAIEACRTKTLPSSSLLVLCMDKASKLYNAGEMTAEEVMSAYENIMTIASGIYERKPTAALESAMADVEQVFATSGVANCENIVALFTPKFASDSTNKDFVSGLIKLMTDANCTDEALFQRAVEALHSLDPSSATAYALYRLNASKGNHKEAVALLEDAISQEDSDAMKDADYYLELATYNFKYMSNNAKAIADAKEAINLNPALKGKAYLLIATIWASMDCPGNDIEQRARFWVAVDYLYRAKAADASVSEEANQHIANYSKYFPLTEDAFMYDLADGASYTVNCGGLRETTTVRTNNE